MILHMCTSYSSCTSMNLTSQDFVMKLLEFCSGPGLSKEDVKKFRDEELAKL